MLGVRMLSAGKCSQTAPASQQYPQRGSFAAAYTQQQLNCNCLAPWRQHQYHLGSQPKGPPFGQTVKI